MREILFRGKRLDNGEWVEGSLAQAEDGDWILVFEYTFVMAGRPLSKTTSTHQVAPETVGQFTGLLDKNGTKIFEGDIVKEHGSGVVVFDTENVGSCGCCYEFFVGSGFMCEGLNLTNSEVIGNIHEEVTP